MASARSERTRRPRYFGESAFVAVFMGHVNPGRASILVPPSGCRAGSLFSSTLPLALQAVSFVVGLTELGFVLLGLGVLHPLPTGSHRPRTT